MSREYQVPGGPYVNETSSRQYQLPGGSYINETQSGSAPVYDLTSKIERETALTMGPIE